MSEVDDLRARVDRVEAELAEVRAKAESAQTLARFADRDASDIKSSHAGIVRSLNALRETQLEQGRVLNQHTEVLNQHTEVLNQHTEVLNQHTEVLNQHTESFGTVRAGIEQIIARLDTLTDEH